MEEDNDGKNQGTPVKIDNYPPPVGLAARKFEGSEDGTPLSDEARRAAATQPTDRADS